MGHRRDWQKTDPDLHLHPSFKRLCRTLKAKPYEVDGWLSTLWRSAFSQAEDGDLTRFGYEGVADMAEYEGDPQAFLEALAGAHFVDTDDPSTPTFVRIHGWAEWGGALFAERTRWAKEKAEQRAEKSSGHSETTKDVGQGPDDPRAKRESKTLRSSALHEFRPDFPPWWEAYGKVGNRAQAEEKYLAWRAKGASREDLLTAARNYRAWCQATDTLQKHGRTFLATRINIWEEYVNPDTAPAAKPHDLTTPEHVIACFVCQEELSPEDLADRAAYQDGKGWCHDHCPGEEP